MTTHGNRISFTLLKRIHTATKDGLCTYTELAREYGYSVTTIKRHMKLARLNGHLPLSKQCIARGRDYAKNNRTRT